MADKVTKVVRCPLCGKWVKNPVTQPDGSWRGQCSECGEVNGTERGRDK